MLQPKDKVDERHPRARPSTSSATASTASAWPSPRSPARATPSWSNLPGVKDQDKALQIVGQTAELRFRPVLEALPPDARRSPPTTTPTTTVARRHHDRRRRGHHGRRRAGDGGRRRPRCRRRRRCPPPPPSPGPTHHDRAPTPARPDDAAGRGRRRPRRSCCPELDDKTATSRARYLLGPAFLTGSAVETAAAKFDQNTNEYVVNLTLKGGANGIDTWNKVAQQCFNGDATCPARARTGRARSPSPSTAS